MGRAPYRIFPDTSPTWIRALFVVDAHLSVVSVCLDEDAFEAGLNVVDVVIVLQGTVKKIENNVSPGQMGSAVLGCLNGASRGS